MTASAPLVIVSGPSGSGKSTVIGRVLQICARPLHLSVSATTRSPRSGEQEGVHYHFWDADRFEREVQADAFLEWAHVHGNRYGTLRAEVNPYRQRGIGVILDVDVQGAAQVRKLCPDSISVFLKAPTPEAYEERLRLRGSEKEPSLQVRLQAGVSELTHANEYDYQIVNDDAETAARELSGVIERHFEGGPACSTT